MEQKKDEKKCDICKNNATTICYDCSFYLCNSCFEFIHQKNRNLEHKNEPITSFISFDIRCPEHPKIPLSLFCTEEKSKIYIFIILIYFYLFRAFMFIVFF